MKLVLNENAEKVVLSENLKFHLKNKMNIHESVFRIGSDSWCDLINEVRELYEDGMIVSNAGEYGLYEGEDVPLDAPFLLEVQKDGTKVYGVFVLDENYDTKKVIFK